jgi:adenylosuccinate synthase
MTVDLLLGLQMKEKGKIVDVLTSKYDIIARFQGGPNAGHTLEFDGIKHVLRTIPSGIFHGNNVNVIGGVVIDPVVFKSEVGLAKFNLDLKSKLIISRKAHLIYQHTVLDAASEASFKGKAIGSTLVNWSNMDKTGRNGIVLEISSWKTLKNVTELLADKHEAMIAFMM